MVLQLCSSNQSLVGSLLLCVLSMVKDSPSSLLLSSSTASNNICTAFVSPLTLWLLFVPCSSVRVLLRGLGQSDA